MVWENSLGLGLWLLVLLPFFLLAVKLSLARDLRVFTGILVLFLVSLALDFLATRSFEPLHLGLSLALSVILMILAKREDSVGGSSLLLQVKVIIVLSGSCVLVFHARCKGNGLLGLLQVSSPATLILLLLGLDIAKDELFLLHKVTLLLLEELASVLARVLGHGFLLSLIHVFSALGAGLPLLAQQVLNCLFLSHPRNLHL